MLKGYVIMLKLVYLVYEACKLDRSKAVVP